MRPHMGTGRVSGSTTGLCPLHQTQLLLVGSGVVGSWAHCRVQVILASIPQEGDQLPVAMKEPHEGGEQHVPAHTHLPCIGSHAAHTDPEAQG